MNVWIKYSLLEESFMKYPPAGTIQDATAAMYVNNF